MISNEQYQELIERYSYTFKEGDYIEGTIAGFEGNNALVDIGAKTLAICKEQEFLNVQNQNIKDVFKIGSKIKFVISSKEDENGVFYLSHRKVAIFDALEKIKEKFENNEIVTGTITSISKGGAIVNVSGVKGFVPLSHLKQENAKVGLDIELKILSIDTSKNDFILSNKKVYLDSIEEIRKEIFDKIEVGMVVKGEVVRLADFGAFIDIGGVDGLLPLSQMSWNWIDNPKDILELNDKIDVEIINIDKDMQRISLSIKTLKENPWLEAKDEIQENSIITGKVTRIKPFGIFVEIHKGVEGLLNKAQAKAIQAKLQKPLEIGDNIELTVKKFDIENRKIIFETQEK